MGMVYVRLLQDWPSPDHPLIPAGTIERFDERRANTLVATGKGVIYRGEEPVDEEPPVHKQIKQSRRK
jgi:hypothetical protein